MGRPEHEHHQSSLDVFQFPKHCWCFRNPHLRYNSKTWTQTTDIDSPTPKLVVVFQISSTPSKDESRNGTERTAFLSLMNKIQDPHNSAVKTTVNDRIVKLYHLLHWTYQRHLLDIYIQLQRVLKVTAGKFLPPKKWLPLLSLNQLPFLPLPFFGGEEKSDFSVFIKWRCNLCSIKSRLQHSLPTPDIECFRRPDFSRTERSPVDLRETERLDENIPFSFAEWFQTISKLSVKIGNHPPNRGWT